MAAEEKKSPIQEFQGKLRETKEIKGLILEGLKSANARVRSAAVKMAFKLRDHDFIKKNVLPLVGSEKSKKVLRAVSQKITRRSLKEKVEKLLVPKKAHGKKTDAPKEEAAAQASTPKAPG